MLFNSIYIVVSSLTSEFRGTVTNLQAPTFIGAVDWGCVFQALMTAS
jgi:hypothetical protein